MCMLIPFKKKRHKPFYMLSPSMDKTQLVCICFVSGTVCAERISWCIMLDQDIAHDETVQFGMPA